MKELKYNSPKSLIYIRHGQSQYNAQKTILKQSKEYIQFSELYKIEWSEIVGNIKKGRIDISLRNIEEGIFPSKELRDFAYILLKKFPVTSGPFDTELTKEGRKDVVTTGKNLKKKLGYLPDHIYVSPYLRTQQTLEALIEGWEELGSVRIEKDIRLREQEHGLESLYNNKKVANTFNPKNGLLMELESNYTYRYSNGESLLDVIDRHSAFFKHLYRVDLNKNVLVVGHHLGLLSLLSINQKWDRERFLYEDENNYPINAGVTIFEPDLKNLEKGKLFVSEYNTKLY